MSKGSKNTSHTKNTSKETKKASEGTKKQTTEGSKDFVEIKAQNLTPEERAFLEKYMDELSPTTLRARWINNLNEHEDHPGQTLATQNPEVIKHWAEERSGTPTTVPGTEYDDQLGMLRINFPGYGGKELQEVGWEKWMQTFKDRKLVFLYQEHMRNGQQSNFFHMDSPYRGHD